MKKRVLSLLMAFVMAVGLLPASALAADSMTVYVTISDKGVLAADKNGEPMGYRAVTVTDQDADGQLTVSDALIKAHTEYCNEGAAGYAISYGYANKVWGISSTNLLAFVNNVGFYVAWDKKTIIDGDHVVASINADNTTYADWYTYFDLTSKEVKADTEFSLTLMGFQGMAGGTPEAVSGTTVGTWNNGVFTSLEKSTDSAGQVSLSFDSPGTYYVTASGTVRDEVTNWGTGTTAEKDCPMIAPVCVVTVTEEQSDAEYVAADKTALNVTYTAGQNLTLLSTGASGKTNISWLSNTPAVISNNGVVTIPAQDTEVSLTATITCNGETDTKGFSIMVPGCLNAAKAALTSKTLTPVEFTNAIDGYYRYDSVAKDTNILTMANQLVSYLGVTVDLSAAVDGVIDTNGKISYPANAAAEITVPFVLDANGVKENHNVTITVPKHAQTKAEAIEAMKKAMPGYMADAKVLNGNVSLDEVKTTLLLPGGKTSGLYITWTSDNESVIKVTGNPSSSSAHPTGGKYEVKVNRPDVGEEDAEVTLTATFVYKETSVLCGAGPMPVSGNTMKFAVTVPAVTKAEMQAIVENAAADIRITDKNGAAANLSNIKDNLYFPSYDGFTTKWTTDISGIQMPSSGYGKATVTRPEKGANDQVGTITLTITAGEVEETKTFDAKVLAWTEEDLNAAQNQLNQVAEALTFDAIKGNNSSADTVVSNLYLKRFASFADGTVSLEHMTKSDANTWPVAITWEITPSNGPITYNDRQANNGTGIVTTPAQDTKVALKATINYRTLIVGVDAVEKTIDITVPVAHTPNTAASLETLLDGTAAGLTNTGEWEAFLAMAAYEAARPDGAKRTETAKQNMINTSVAKVSAASPKESDWTKAILDMQSMGVDPRQLYPVNSNTPVDAVAGLNGMTHNTGVWTAAYTLLSWQQGDYSIGTQEADLVTALLATQLENGGWTSWKEAEADATGLMIQALAAYYDTNDVAKTAVDKAIDYLSGVQLDNGGFGGQWGENANNEACVISGLCAMGINPDTDSRFIKNGKSALDALLEYALPDNSGFTKSLGSTTLDGFATKQAFAALIAAYHVMSTGTAYNVYDFSGNTLVPGRATGTGSVVTPSDPSGETITVTLSIKSDTSYWLRSKAVTLPGTDATVYHALVNGLKDTGITQVGAETGYVKSMTKGGTTLKEFGNGKNAGWMYKVNGELPEVGLTDCEIENGDVIVWFYTEDWTSVPGAGGLGSVDQEETEEPTAFPFTDVSEGDYYYDAVQWAVEKGITLGTSDTTFHPEAGCTRGQMVTFLWRAAGEPAAKTSDCVFTDVDKDAYYYEALLWAVENGITTGTSDTKFSPDGDCTRGQMAVFLHRSAKTPAVSGSHTFDDVKSDAYYSDAVTWAAAEGITTGTSETTFHPNGDCTRGQMVTFLMRYLETIA